MDAFKTQDNRQYGQFMPQDTTESTPIYDELQLPRNDKIKDEPVSMKLNFIRPCYGLLIVYLLLSTLISIPFLENPNTTMLVLAENSWIMWLAVVVLTLQVAFYLVVLLTLSRRRDEFFKVYISMMVRTPINIIWGALYVSCFTTVVDAALTAWGQSDLCYVFVYTLLGVMGLLFYTYAMKNADFTHMYGYLVPIFTAVFLSIVMALFSLKVHWTALALSVLLGWIVVYETQLIFGTKLERGRKYSYQVGMYVMAANEMYFDLFIHFYLGALGVIKPGEPDDRTII